MRIFLCLAVLLFIGSCAVNSGGNNTGANLPPNTVQMVNSAFTPAVLTVGTNTRVTFTNMDGMAHTVTSSSGQSYDSGTIPANGGYAVTFTNLGTNAYFCGFHGSMTGKVVVTN